MFDAFAFLFALAMSIAISAAFLVVQSAFVLVVWNWVIPPVFNGPHLHFWSALGLSFLVFLFSGGVQRTRIESDGKRR